MEKLFSPAILGGEKYTLAFISNLLQASTEFAIIGLDLDGKILLWNVGASNLFGYDVNEMLEKGDFSKIDTQKNVDLFQKIKEITLKEGKWEQNVECTKKTGEKFTAHFTTTIHIDTGTPIGILLVANDITNHLRFEKLQKLNIEQLEKEKFYNRSLIDSVPSALIITDIDGRISDCNAEAEKMIGYAHDELLNSFFKIYFVDEKLAMETIKKIMAGEILLNQELMVRKKSGEELVVNFNASKIYDQLGKEQGVFTAGTDITEKKAMDKLLRDKNIELEFSILAKDRFLASMSHELRTPLNAINGFTELLLAKNPEPLSVKQIEYLKIIDQSAKLLLSLINDLLDVAKIESGTMKLKLEKMSCQSVINEVSSLLSPLIKAKNLEFILKFPDEEIFVDSDRRTFKQILINILNNAIKFTEEGKIEIKLSKSKIDKKAVVIILITDTGIGISPEDQEKLFQAFKQVDAATKVHQEGAGLGLYLSKSFASLMGGRITFESELGKGSQFSIILPARSEIKPRVLVIEDNPNNLKLVITLLGLANFQIFTAIDGEEGLALAKKEIPDIILCDIQLPKLNGYEIVKQLKSIPQFRKIPIIAVSAFAMLDDTEKAVKAGFDGFITKPIDVFNFVLQVEEFLESAHPTVSV